MYTSYPVLGKVRPRKKGRTYQAFLKKEASYYKVQKVAEPHPQLIRMGIKTCIYIPLHYQGNAIGVMNILSLKETSYSSQELNFLKLFGSLASLAINKAQLYSETKTSLENQNLFLSLASHEIKTPLTAILTYIQVLERKAEAAGADHLGIVQKLHSEAKRLTYLVAELLDKRDPNLTLKSYSWKKCDLRELIERAVTNFSFVHPTHEVIFRDLVSTKEAFVWGDFDKLLQVFTNILDNSGKYSPPTSKIKITLKDQGSVFRISIKDLGKGIEKTEVKNLFQKYYRSLSETQEGLGLGLYIVKTIVANHQGTMKITSKVGVGTTFSVLLPKFQKIS